MVGNSGEKNNRVENNCSKCDRENGVTMGVWRQRGSGKNEDSELE